MKKIIFSIHQGIIQLEEGQKYLEGIALEIRDYDCEGIDETDLKTDKDNNEYFLQTV